MEIQEDSFEEIKEDKKETKNLTLRKPKANQKNKQKDNIDIFKVPISFNELLPGEIELKNEEIIFSHKKRQRDQSSSLINLPNKNSSNIIMDENSISQEEKNLSEKALEIFKELNIPPTPGLKEGDYDTDFHDKRETIVKKLLKDEDMIMKQRELACITKNIDIYCSALDNFNTFSYYNNKFMVNSHRCLDKIVENSFTFADKTKSIPLALKFAKTMLDFGFFEE